MANESLNQWVLCVNCGAMNGHHLSCPDWAARPQEPEAANPHKVVAKGWKGFNTSPIWTIEAAEACWRVSMKSFIDMAKTFGEGWARAVEKEFPLTGVLSIRAGLDMELADPGDSPMFSLVRMKRRIDPLAKGENHWSMDLMQKADLPRIHKLLNRETRLLLPREVLRIVRRVEAATEWVRKAVMARDRHAMTLRMQAEHAMRGKRQAKALAALQTTLVMDTMARVAEKKR